MHVWKSDLSQHFDQNVQPLLDDIDELLTPTAPPYLIYPSTHGGKRAMIVEVENASNDAVTLRPVDGHFEEITEAPF